MKHGEIVFDRPTAAVTKAMLHEKWFGVKAAPGSAAVTVYPGYGVPGMDGYDPTVHTPKCN
jgi:polar amino acid transport system substrate-binding protein